MPRASAVDYFSPRTAGLGGAGRAGPLGTDSIYLAPAMTSFQKTYAISSSFDGYTGHDDTEPRGRVFNGSIVDGTNEMFQAGIGYTRRADATLFHFGASKALTNWLGFGIGGKRMFEHPGRDTVNQGTASTVVDIFSFLKAAITVDNLNEDRKSRTWNLYREYGLGLKASLRNILLLYYDPSYTPNLPQSKFGQAMAAELMVFQGFYVRYGINRNVIQANLGEYGRGIGYGGGFIFPKLSIDFSIYRTMTPQWSSGKLISATLMF